jgi:exosortase A
MTAVSPEPTFSRWSAVTAIALVELLLIALFYDTAAAMVGIWWRSETFNHAFLVPPISLWLIWERRHTLAGIVPRPTWWLLPVMAGLAVAWLLGELAAVNAVTQLAFVAMLVLAVPLVLGLPLALQIAFPLGFLFFAVPIGEFVMPKLMDWTADFTVLALRASGIPVYQEGLQFIIPSGRWSVVEACSGVRYLLASLTVGTLYAYLNYHSLKRRLIFVLVSLLVPVAANWGRAYLIVMLGHLSGNELATGADHLIYGWVFFGIVILIMFAIGMRWREPDLIYDAAAERAAALLARAHTQIKPLALAALTVLVVGAAPHLMLSRVDSQATLATPIVDGAGLDQSGWSRLDTPPADWQPDFANPSTILNLGLGRNQQRVGIFIAYYRQQGYERKLISSQNVLAVSNDELWAQVSRGGRQVAISGETASIRSGVLRGQHGLMGSEPQRLLVWHWYWIDGRWVASDHLGKLYLALSRLLGRGDDSAAIFFYAPEDIPGGAEAALEKAVAATGGALRQTLESTRARR